jgi:hypothetical protein
MFLAMMADRGAIQSNVLQSDVDAAIFTSQAART